MAIVLSSASQVIASGVCPNESEDLAKNNLDKGWVDDTHNDLMFGFNIGTPPLEDAQEDVSPVFQGEPVQDDPARAPSLVPEGKSLSSSQHTFDLSGSSSNALSREDLEQRLMRVDSPPQVDDVCLVPFGSRVDRLAGGPSLQPFDAEGESLFDDL